MAFLGVLVEQDRMALGEGPTLAVLAREAHRVAFLEQGAEGKTLSGGPINPLAGLDRFCAVIKETLDGFMDLEIRRHHGDLLADLAQRFDRNAGVAAARVLGLTRRFHAGPAA